MSNTSADRSEKARKAQARHWLSEAKGRLHGDGPCGLCGKDPADGYACVTSHDGPTVWLCHPTDSPDGMTCYHRWTVYGGRPEVPAAEVWDAIARKYELEVPADVADAGCDFPADKNSGKVTPREDRHKLEVTPVRLSDDLRRQVRERAAAEERTQAQVIRRALRAYLESPL